MLGLTRVPLASQGVTTASSGTLTALAREPKSPPVHGERNASKDIGRGLRLVGRRDRPGAGTDLSEQADDDDHSVCGGRTDRRARPRDGAAHERTAWSTGSGRE